MNKIVILTLSIFISCFETFASAADTITVGAFGKVTIYKPKTAPNAVVLFVSGDGGWNSGVVDMAKNIVDQGALVAGIDIQHYFKAIKKQKVKCYYPAGDFEELSMILQKKLKINQYLKPILVGYSSGATLVYGMLAQAPANTFSGAIALGFCPDIETDKTLCDGTGLTSHVLKEGKAYYLEKTEKLTAPFIVLQGTTDQVCNYADTKIYMDGLKQGKLISLSKVGHGFSVTRNWLPQFIEAYKEVLSTPNYAKQQSQQNSLLKEQHLTPLSFEMPLTLIPTKNKNEDLPVAFLISGDGGWTSFDQSFGEALAEKGIPVIALDAQKYFWNAKTPLETANAIAKATEHYMQQWNKKTFVLVGYSFGASVVPFAAANFPESLKEKLKGVYAFSPDVKADFEIHIADMLSLESSSDNYDVISEMKKIKAYNPVCFFGTEEDSETRNRFSESGIKTIEIPGSHHFNNDYNKMAENILKEIK
ncbi:AcvB/VirJ family lysyl-phosphatidylglycerol hydrolase [Flavobacterium phragmitis]|uniref:Type IV secretory pathway, VirJ component n=1 Tax=Flavobacterium phragmitis TaxID=739143 RepID=A0A1I1SVR1_9FLAO|nr:AcvB/VirJ family lysyl-phosphatidylglycerol hydrolase [Flavobacterium phragmitis]SFD50442.1 Type IV secretory pathway, VirJ component [Flavobacterium phragmitis]